MAEQSIRRMFSPSRTLLNPKFEGYKLDLVSQEDIVARYPLEYKPTQATVSGRSTFSLQEIQSRITHNHLAVWSKAGRAVYVDSDARVIAVDIDAGTVQPTFRVLHELPVPIRSDAVETPNREYPSAVFLSPSMVFVSDGYGTMYVLQVKNSGSSDVLGVFTLSPISMEIPFRIHSVHRLSPTAVIAILSSRHHAENADMESREKERVKRPSPYFDIWAVKIELPSLGPKGNTRQLDIIWRRRGQDVPIYTSYEESRKSFILIGGTVYRQVDRQISLAYEPSPDEFVSIPRAGENLDSQTSEPPKPLPYAWSQTHDSVTLAIPLLSSTSKSNIKVAFSPRTLTVHIDSDVSASVPDPRYSAKLLWDGISSSTSYWTWDREAEHSFGLLTLYLDKQHEGTKWSQVFAPAGTSVALESNFDDIEVPETLDPSELWHIREALEKYTTSSREGDDASGLGLGRGVPSLAEGEMDVEVDESVGKEAYLTWVGEDGSIPPWWNESTSIHFQLLATPMPGSDESIISLVVKNHLDGTVHSLISDAPNLTDSSEWTHTSTFSALAFVLASKRDTRFTYHISGNAVFAFEGGARDRGGNVYIYRPAPIKEKWAKQAILKIDDGNGGSLLGVGAVKFGSGATVLACLTEGELVLIKNP